MNQQVVPVASTAFIPKTAAVGAGVTHRCPQSGVVAELLLKNKNKLFLLVPSLRKAEPKCEKLYFLPTGAAALQQIHHVRVSNFAFSHFKHHIFFPFLQTSKNAIVLLS